MYWQGIGTSWLRNGSSRSGCGSQQIDCGLAAINSARPAPGHVQRLGAAGLLAFSLAIGSSAWAQEARPAPAVIERDIATLNQQIASKQQQIATLRNRPSPEQSELNNAQKRLAEARTAFQANGSAENESRAKNAEFKLKLAEIKYNKAHPDVDVLVDEVEQLQSQLAVRQREAKEPRETKAIPETGTAPKAADTQASQAKARQQEQRQQELQRQQEQELARSRQEAEAQQKEIDRLKAALAAKETKETAVHAAPAAAAKPVEQIAATKPAVIGGGAMKLISSQEVAQELQQLAQRLTAPGPDRGANDALYLKRPDTKVTNKDKVILRALGKEQYRGQAQVDAGNYQISVGFNQWPLEFNATEAGQTTFLYDNSDAQKPRLLIYSSSLETAK